jgi:hypothetical protein
MDEHPQTPESRGEPKGDHGALFGALSFVALLGIMSYAWFYALPNGKHWTVGSFFLFMGREAILVLFFLGALVFCVLAGLWRLIARSFGR